MKTVRVLAIVFISILVLSVGFAYMFSALIFEDIAVEFYKELYHYDADLAPVLRASVALIYGVFVSTSTLMLVAILWPKNCNKEKI